MRVTKKKDARVQHEIQEKISRVMRGLVYRMAFGASHKILALDRYRRSGGQRELLCLGSIASRRKAAA